MFFLGAYPSYVSICWKEVIVSVFQLPSDVSISWKRSHCLCVPGAYSDVPYGRRLSLCSSCLVMFPMAGYGLCVLAA